MDTDKKPGMTKQLKIVLTLTLTMVVASLMAVLGTALIVWHDLNPPFAKCELVIPSLLTWVLLMWCLKRPSRSLVWSVGLGSPFVGAAWALVLKLGPAHEIQYGPGLGNHLLGFAGGLIYAFAFVFVYAPVTFAVGVATAFLMRGVWKIVNESW